MSTILNTVIDFYTPDQIIDVPPPRVLEDLFGKAGVSINGSQPWDIQLLDKQFYQEILARGTLGFGESYMAGYWECSDLAALMTRLLQARLDENLTIRAKLRLTINSLRARIFNLQSKKRAFQVGEKHYDIGNDLYAAMLDPHWCYSCGYWEHASDLATAQEHKLELICRKLMLEPGMTVLEVGCGWGSLARYMTEHYGVKVKGITVSKEQAELAKERCNGLPVDIVLQDYRDLTGQFDRIVSVGMFEHVGRKNYDTYFSVLSKCLKKDGLFLLHSIGTDCETPGVDPWIGQYIFPNGELPSLPSLSRALQPCFTVEDLHNFGPDYDLTLQSWWANFYNAWPELSHQYGQHFFRMWRYYLMSCAGFFRSKRGQLWQLVLSPLNSDSVYRSVRYEVKDSEKIRGY